jgi:hypothetical protein
MSQAVGMSTFQFKPIHDPHQLYMNEPIHKEKCKYTILYLHFMRNV